MYKYSFSANAGYRLGNAPFCWKLIFLPCSIYMAVHLARRETLTQNSPVSDSDTGEFELMFVPPRTQHPSSWEWSACIRMHGKNGAACIRVHLGNGPRASACTVKMGPRASACIFAVGRVHPRAREKWGACIRVHVRKLSIASACIRVHVKNGPRASAGTSPRLGL